jgi:non-ribosomal peptide synthase protein (TIGR01720 family)
VQVPEVREWLKSKLPAYMVPGALVVLGQMPLTVNGKVDRQQLPDPESSAVRREQYVAPRTQTEQVLAQIWAQVLGLEQVGIHDNFFELGGDSILAIRIVALAAQSGIRFTVRQAFENQTIASLATLLQHPTASLTVNVEQGRIVGPVPLTPIQSWFFEWGLEDPNSFCQTTMLICHRKLSANPLQTALNHLLSHHDALRLRFRQTSTGWVQSYDTPQPADCVAPLQLVDMSSREESSWDAEFQRIAERVGKTINISFGPMVSAALCHCGDDRDQRLLIVIHHLVVDVVSWQILLADLFTVYRQCEQGESVVFPIKTSPFVLWARRLQNHAHSKRLNDEAELWRTLGDVEASRLEFPLDPTAQNDDRRTIIEVNIDSNDTELLFREVIGGKRFRMTEILLAAIVMGFESFTSSRTLVIDLEGHGREDLFDSVDLTRTVGWFTTVFPVRVDLRDAKTALEALQSVKETLRRIPNNGIGYGILRHLRGDAQFARHPAAVVGVNYLGQVDRSSDELEGWANVSTDSTVQRIELRGPPEHQIEIVAFRAQGCLQLHWICEAAVANAVRSAAGLVVQTLQELIVEVTSSEIGFTLADFPLLQTGYGTTEIEGSNL